MSDVTFVGMLLALATIGVGAFARLLRTTSLRPLVVITRPQSWLDGAVCLAMTLRIHGKAPRMDDEALIGQLENRVNDEHHCCNALRIIETAKAFGLDARGVRIDVGDVEHLRRGDMVHFVTKTLDPLDDLRVFRVLERVDGNVIHVVDPVLGRVPMTRELFAQDFSGVALVFGR